MRGGVVVVFSRIARMHHPPLPLFFAWLLLLLLLHCSSCATAKKAPSSYASSASSLWLRKPMPPPTSCRWRATFTNNSTGRRDDNHGLYLTRVAQACEN